MPQNELCSQCFVNTNRMMQSSPYSIFQSALESPYLKARLQYIHSTCGIGTGPTHVEDPQYLPIKQHPIPCFTEVVHTSQVGDTCDSVALKYSIASAALQSAKTDYITNCTTLAAGNELCIPLTCDNLLSTVWVHGRTLCLSPQNGIYNVSNPIPGVVVASGDSTGYTSRAIPPPGNGTVANSTTLFCGGWHTITSAEETSAKICISNGITSDLFYQINPSLAVSGAGDCTTLLKVGITYCVGPIWSWADLEADISHMN
ncbi:peptidoglycan binding domain-containing protein [Penicillium oxalicum 114-2]|uniref:Peptidoglycan binding domain-containing protein n=1 Tax=Penicillium oxalicum (strain 114-2 / CGMCC 5302) TaxID=933388 RepID=S7ZLL5_PENO1|nr:peptidoglycan binding domain-containing protein [Penicillium oxalicum 114-2]